MMFSVPFTKYAIDIQFLHSRTVMEMGSHHHPVRTQANLRSLKRLSHASQGHHLDDLVLGYAVLASFPSKATIFHTAEAIDSQ